MVVEDHLQTEHKLDVARSWFGAYLTIVAKAKTLPNHREAWIVDTTPELDSTGPGSTLTDIDWAVR